MWERSKLKENAKVTFKKYYWKAVIVAFLSFILTGGLGNAADSARDIRNSYNSTVNENYLEEYNDDFDIKEEIETISKDLFGEKLVFMVVNVFIIGLIISWIIKLLIVYPIIVGTNHYFMGIREKEKSIDSLLFAYKSGKLMNTVVTMLVMNIFIYLWSLLLIIPGIVKSYEYRMIPYILSENPNISRKRAFEISKKMMDGNKWDTFVLDLSFIGWDILSMLTAGLLSVFYVNPYVQSTNAELYAFLREEALASGDVGTDELIGFA